MKSKTGLAFLTFSVALFASGRLANFISHSQSYGNVAWAQDASDSTDDGADVATEPDKKVPPPDIEGDWSGSIVDDETGSTSFAIEVFQKHSKFTELGQPVPAVVALTRAISVVTARI